MRPVVNVADQLRERIVSGELSPGSALRQESLAAELGVSRIPIRDALSKLAGEGLVEIHANRGAYVTTLTPAQCAELFDLRVLLECDALSHAIPRHTPRTLRALQAIQTELELEDETPRWAEGDRRFHEALYAPSGRERTLETIRTFRNAVERFYLANLSHNAGREPWKEEHRKLLQAVTAGNIDLARTRLTAHLRATEAIVLAVILQHPS